MDPPRQLRVQEAPSSSVTFGQSSMTIKGYAWTTGALTPDPGTTTTYTNVTSTYNGNGSTVYALDSNGYFTSGICQL
jgi:uncharacterized membrane protein